MGQGSGIGGELPETNTKFVRTELPHPVPPLLRQTHRKSALVGCCVDVLVYIITNENISFNDGLFRLTYTILNV